jgi:hypothetical protein
MVIVIELDNILRDLNSSILKYYDEYMNEKSVVENNEIVDDEYIEQKITNIQPKKDFVWLTNDRELTFENKEDFKEFIRTYSYEFLFSSTVNEHIKPLLKLLREKKYNIFFGVNTDIIPNSLVAKKTTLHYFIKNDIDFDGILIPNNDVVLKMAYLIQYKDNTIQLYKRKELILTDNIFLRNILNFFQNL